MRSQLMKRLALFSSLFLALSAVACGGLAPEERSFGGLDTDGDGELTSADVADGQVAVFFQHVGESAGEPAADEGEALTTVTATITPGGSFGWYLTADLEGSELSIRFEGDYPLAAGEGTVTNASYDVDDEHFAYGSEPGGAVEVTARSPSRRSPSSSSSGAGATLGA
jgi:hypothetical protein